MKKWLIIGIVAALLVGGLVGYFISQGGALEVGVPGEGRPVTSGTIQVPDGPKIKVVFNGPPELKVSWEKLGMSGFQLHVIGTLTNVSNQTVEFSEIAFLLDGKQVSFIYGPSSYGENLEPGEQMEIAKGLIGYTEYTKVLEVKIKGFEIVGGSVTTPEPTEPEPTTPTEPTTPEPSETVFTKAPRNPTTPGEVTAAFYCLYNEKKYSEAEKLLARECRQRVQSRGGLENFYEEWFQGRQLKKIEFGEIEIIGDSAQIFSVVLYYTDGSEESPDDVILLEKENGKWKIAM